MEQNNSYFELTCRIGMCNLNLIRCGGSHDLLPHKHSPCDTNDGHSTSVLRVNSRTDVIGLSCWIYQLAVMSTREYMTICLALNAITDEGTGFTSWTVMQMAIWKDSFVNTACFTLVTAWLVLCQILVSNLQTHQWLGFSSSYILITNLFIWTPYK